MVRLEQSLEVRVKLELEDRVRVLNSCLNKPEDRDGIDRQMLNEIQFLERVLKMMEKVGEVQPVPR